MPPLPSGWSHHCASPVGSGSCISLAAPILTWAAWPFYKAAIRNARHGIATMDTLVSMGIVAATAWSIYAMFFRDTSHVARSWRYVLAHQSAERSISMWRQV